MSVAAIRTAIVTRMLTVADIGVVHPYERYSTDLAKLKALYGYNGAIRGWFVRRPRTTETANVLGRTVEQIRWRLQGYMAFNDAAASEITFDGLIEGLRDVFAADQTIGGVVDQCTDPSNPDGESCIQLDDAGPVMFGGVLCHAARLGLTTTRYLERQP
jgi:hypothetical protein